jgi:hypothetical protein
MHIFLTIVFCLFATSVGLQLFLFPPPSVPLSSVPSGLCLSQGQQLQCESGRALRMPRMPLRQVPQVWHEDHRSVSAPRDQTPSLIRKPIALGVVDKKSDIKSSGIVLTVKTKAHSLVALGNKPEAKSLTNLFLR